MKVIREDISSENRIPGSDLDILWVNHIAQIPRQEWDALAVPLKTPFLEWDWLLHLETSQSIVPETGWIPSHLTLWRQKRLVAAAPLYIKTHSAGEFVFDHFWADVAENMGIAYYPKLVGMTPVTPVSGYQFLIGPHEAADQIVPLILKAINSLCLRHRLSGVHFLFVTPDMKKQLSRWGYGIWKHQSYEWLNPDFSSFEDYLSLFKTNQRRNIRRERKKLKDMGIRLQTFAGRDIPESFIDPMYQLYQLTNAKFGPWGCKYLNQSFFRKIFHHFYRNLLLSVAFEKDAGSEPRPLAMSFLVTKGDQLYGRYWGCFKDVDALHFNVCYYAPIEWAINHGIHRFDPGVGSPHKARRGFRSVPAFSLHHFYDSRLQHIFDLNIDRVNQLEQEQIDQLNDYLPLKRKPF
jgi:predicted N-acyltransferase